MGCDIHVCCEFRKDGQWKSADLFYMYDGIPKVVPVYNFRSYMLFGILAGVRSFEYEPICEPRGMPDDCCESTKNLYDCWGADAHTPSYLTYRELQERLKVCSRELDGWTSEYEVLLRFVKPVFERMCDIFWIFIDDVTDEKYFGDRALSHSDDFRVVFWFDN